MTKRRAPLSIDAALARIAGHVPGGFEAMAKRVERSVRTVRNWSDPDTPEQIPLDCAVALDILFQEHAGDGAPLLEAHETLVDLAGRASFAGGIALGRLAAEAIRECGEANAALVTAAQPGATEAQMIAAAREAEEGIAALSRARQQLPQPP
jgi:hypothetical protein